MNITIIDSICGTGKTSWAIQYMNENEDRKFIYITPFLNEVKRVKNECTNRYFYEPNVKGGSGSKFVHFKRLIAEGKNIVSTHALFSYVTEETIQNLKENNYTLILDEVFNVVQEINIKKSDRTLLINNNMIEIMEDGKVNWTDMEYDGTLNDYRMQIENGDVYLLDNSFLIWTFPIKVFSVFKEIYILTYLFNGQLQRYYYDMYNISYEYKSVISTTRSILKNGETNEFKTYKLTNYNPTQNLNSLKKLINICDNSKLNVIGNKKGKGNPLSKSWYISQNKKKLDGFDILKKNMTNYFQNICRGKSCDNAWTTFKEFRSKLSGNRYSKGFIPCNARATNEYKHKKNLAYCINVFSNPKLIKFFISKGVTIDEDAYALAELVQWIFRSSIRNNEPINLYVPSERMRTLLINWLNCDK